MSLTLTRNSQYSYSFIQDIQDIFLLVETHNKQLETTSESLEMAV